MARLYTEQAFNDLKQELAEMERLHSLVSSLQDLTAIARGMVPRPNDDNGALWTFLDNNFYNAENALKSINESIEYLRQEIANAGLYPGDVK